MQCVNQCVGGRRRIGKLEEGMKHDSFLILYQMTPESYKMVTLLSTEIIKFDKHNPKLRSRKQIFNSL